MDATQIRPPLDDLPDVLTIEEARLVLRLGRNTMYEAVRRGEVPVIRIGRRLLVPRARLQRLLDELDRPDAVAAQSGSADQ